MFRLLALLCGGLFLAMLIGGQDRGQLRFGLMNQPDETTLATPVQIAEPAAVDRVPVVEASFAPEKPVMVQPAAQPVTEVADVPAADGKVMYIGAEKANVRQGPGKEHAVVDRLARGEAVLVVSQDGGPDGWSLIRIEGDGVEGYVASRLLTE